MTEAQCHPRPDRGSGYQRFLSRNKLYTAIEVVGLSLALADIGEHPGIGQSGAVVRNLYSEEKLSIFAETTVIKLIQRNIDQIVALCEKHRMENNGYEDMSSQSS